MKWMMSAAFAVCMALPAAAQQQCMPTSAAYDFLADNHGERRVFQAPADGVVMELWVNDQTGSWTLFVTRPDGLSCLVIAGEGMTYQPVGLRL